MATNKRDIEFIIRAKNQASQAFNAVQKALDDLEQVQSDLGTSTSKSGSELDKFAKIATTVGVAYGKIRGEVDKAAESFRRQEQAAAETKAQYQSLVSQMEAAQRVQSKMAEFVGPRTKEQSKQFDLVVKAYKALQAEADRLKNTIDKQDNSLKQSFYALQELSGGSDAAAAALKRVEEAQRKAAEAAAQAAKEQKNQAEAAQRLAATESRRSALGTKRDMVESLTGSKQAWLDAQKSIREYVQQVGGAGQRTSEQQAAFERLQKTARDNKAAYNELRQSIELYNRVLRDSKSTQEQIAAAQQRAQASLRSTQAALGATISQTRNASAESRRLSEARRVEVARNSELDRTLRSLFSNSRRSLSLYQRMRGEVLSLTASYVGLYAAIDGANKVLRASMDMQAVESRLNVVVEGDEDLRAKEITWVREEADRLGFSMKTLASEWSKFAVSAQASNFSIAESRKIFTSITEAGRVLKLESTQIERAFVALTQMMSKGTIQMEELRQQLGEHIPGAFAIMAKAVGVSGAELTKMMERGELTSDYLLNFADELDSRFGSQLPNALKTTQAELGRFETAVFLALNKIADAGFLEAFTEALRDLQELLRSPEADVFFERVGAGSAMVIKGLQVVAKNLDLILVLLSAWGTTKVVGYVVGLGRAMADFATQTRKANAAMVTATATGRGMGAALSLALGPIGVVVGLIAGAVTHLALRVSETDKIIASSKKTISEITTAYNLGADGAKKWTDALKNITTLQMERELINLQKEAEKTRKSILDPFGFNLFGSGDLKVDEGIREIRRLIKEARSGEITIAELRKRLDELGNEVPGLRKAALIIQDSSEKALEAEDNLRRYEAALRLVEGRATSADKELLGLSDAIEEVNENLDEGPRAIERYTQALRKLGDAIPEIKLATDYEDAVKAIERQLQIAIENAGGDPKLEQDAKDRAAQAISYLRKEYDDRVFRELQNQVKGDDLRRTMELIKGFEGFISTPKWDVNAYRVGYGSDTVTLSDGSVKKVTQGMSVSVEDANRDLIRRIGEFQDIVKRQVGNERWSAFSADQRAALTSIAYNYGSLPKRILTAVREGTAEEMRDAVLALRSDNGGINASRREQEAALLGGYSPTLEIQMQAEADKLAEKRALLIKQINEELDKQYYAISRSALESEIYNNTVAKGIDLHSEEGQEIAEKVRKIWQAGKAGEEAESRINDLMQLRKELQDQLSFHQQQGDMGQIPVLRDQLDDVNVRLREAIQNAVEFYEALGGEKSELALARLKNIGASLETNNQITLDAKQINQQFTQLASDGFAKIGDAIGGWIEGTLNGKEVLSEIRDAFLNFAADFLRQIAQMIIQQAIFNAIVGSTGAGGSGGLGGFISGIFRHNGGIVNGSGVTGLVPTAAFAGAMRYHTGGIAGLKPNEVPVILERGEEVLTRDDPRHRANGGMGQQGAPANVKVVNAIDSGSFISAGLNTDVGQQAILNYISANPNAIKTALQII